MFIIVVGAGGPSHCPVLTNSKPPASESRHAASDICRVAHGMGKLPKAERDLLLVSLAMKYKQPLAESDKVGLARMTKRQLSRLGKGHFCRTDQAFILALIEIKKELEYL